MGIDGGCPERSFASGLFRTFDIGWLEGIDGGCPERSIAELSFPNFRHRVVVGGDGGIACALEKTERGKMM